MKTLTIREARDQLPELIAAVHRGESIVLTDGDRSVSLEPRIALDLEEDSPELEAELLKAVDGPHSPLAEGELRAIASRALRGHRAQRAG